MSERQLSAAWATIRVARATMTELLAGSYLVLPTVGSPTPRVNATHEEVDAHRQSTLRLTTLASLSGFPAVSIPAPSPDDAPLGVSLVSAAGTDRGLLDLAQRVGKELGV